MILIDNREVKFGKFPNGESNLNYNTIEFCHDSDVILKFESDIDLFNLYILKKYMDSCICYNKISLKVLYFPYSRMDRENDFYTFNLKYVAQMINDMNFYEVIVGDIHSDVAPALINNYTGYSSIDILFETFRDEIGISDFSIMFPDAGAQKRYGTGFAYHTLVGFKERDFSDGRILGMKVFGDVHPGKPVVIIDDLCSKGGTFIGAAKALKEAGAGDIYLIVGHCENTIDEGAVFTSGLIKKVYTTDSIYSNPTTIWNTSDRLYVHKLIVHEKRY
jgi:ribose-phosphate pyrophosphokinase